MVRRLKHLDAKLAAVRRLLEQQKDAVDDALADPAGPLPVAHQVRRWRSAFAKTQALFLPVNIFQTQYYLGTVQVGTGTVAF